MEHWSRMTRITVVAVLCILIALILFFTTLQNSKEKNNLLKVTFLDVGQGDSIFIESPSGTQILIDGGPNESVLRALGKEMGFFDRDLDMIVATHPDQDHIGGFISILKRYKIESVLLTENKSDTPVANIFTELLKNEGARILYARRGDVYDLGTDSLGSTTLSILFPDRDPSNLESNTASIVSKLTYGDSTFMFTGDSPSAIEEYLVLLDGTSLKSDVLKAGHHGSRTSSTHTFIEMVKPAYAVISAGKENAYGHPHSEVLEEFQLMNVTTKNTAQSGSIHFVSDGSEVWLR